MEILPPNPLLNHQACVGVSRREFLRVGMALGAIALAAGPLSALAAGKHEFAREGSKGVAKSLRVNAAYFQAVSDVFKGRVPAWLLQSISYVESGHHIYALNIEGKAVMPSSKEEAIRVLSRIGPAVDIGHQQIHYAIWGRQFHLNKESLLDPWTNTLAAGTILDWLLKEHPPFWNAVGRYHSATPARSRKYAWLVYGHAKKAGIWPGTIG